VAISNRLSIRLHAHGTAGHQRTPDRPRQPAGRHGPATCKQAHTLASGGNSTPNLSRTEAHLATALGDVDGAARGWLFLGVSPSRTCPGCRFAKPVCGKISPSALSSFAFAGFRLRARFALATANRFRHPAPRAGGQTRSTADAFPRASVSCALNATARWIQAVTTFLSIGRQPGC